MNNINDLIEIYLKVPKKLTQSQRDLCSVYVEHVLMDDTLSFHQINEVTNHFDEIINLLKI
jgi:hypothetical protein